MRVQIEIKDHVVINVGEDIRLEVEVGALLDDVLAIVDKHPISCVAIYSHDG